MRPGDIRIGIGAFTSAVIAFLCCTAPVVLAVIGLGSAALAVALMRLQWVFIAVAAAVLALSFYAYRRERRRCFVERCEMPARGLTLALLCLSAALIGLLIAGLVFPATTYKVLKLLFG